MPDRYRVIGRYADDVIPPLVAGDVVVLTEYDTREEADIGIEELVARTDIGLISLSSKLSDQWFLLHTWRRTPTGWRHS